MTSLYSWANGPGSLTAQVGSPSDSCGSLPDRPGSLPLEMAHARFQVRKVAILHSIDYELEMVHAPFKAPAAGAPGIGKRLLPQKRELAVWRRP